MNDYQKDLLRDFIRRLLIGSPESSTDTMEDRAELAMKIRDLRDGPKTSPVVNRMDEQSTYELSRNLQGK